MNLFAELIGQENQGWLPLLKQLEMEFRDNNCRYEWMQNSVFQELARTDLPASQRVYWAEILYRMHLASATSVLRIQLWINGAGAAAEDGNLLAFASCLRGFTEASADTWHGLRGIAPTLAENYRAVSDAVTGSASNCLLVEGLEDQLIHFQFGRKVPKTESANVPETHRALHMQAYLESLGTEKGPVMSLYGELCELTHPAKASLDVFMHVLGDGTTELRPCSPKPFIRQLVFRHGKALPTLFGNGINPAMMTLKILNEFPIEKLHTPCLGNFDFSATPTGAKIGKLLGKRF